MTEEQKKIIMYEVELWFLRLHVEPDEWDVDRAMKSLAETLERISPKIND